MFENAEFDIRTLALHKALEILGVSPVYDWCTLQEDPYGANTLWIEQLDLLADTLSLASSNKIIDGKRLFWSERDWDAIFGPYAAIVDAPANVFASSLVKAYPDAKFILTVRDSPESWVHSWSKTIWAEYRIRHSSLACQAMSFLDRLMGKESSYAQVLKRLETVRDLTWENGNEPVAATYVQHNELIRSVVPSERLLEFNVKDGWKPLCHFLGKDIPSEPFPTVNDREVWWQEARQMIERQETRLRKLVIIGVSFVVLGAVASWFYPNI